MKSRYGQRYEQRMKELGLKSPSDPNRFFVYEHRTLDDELIYIGKGTGVRHKSGDHKKPAAWHEKTQFGFKYNILMNDLTEDEALELEEFLIEEIGIENLTNKDFSSSGRAKRYPGSKPVIVEGKEYPSLNAAAISYGIHRDTLKRRYDVIFARKEEIGL